MNLILQQCITKACLLNKSKDICSDCMVKLSSTGIKKKKKKYKTSHATDTHLMKTVINCEKYLLRILKSIY